MTILAIVAGVACVQGACSLRSLDYLGNGHGQGGAMMDSAKGDVDAPGTPSPDTPIGQDTLVENGTVDGMAAEVPDEGEPDSGSVVGGVDGNDDVPVSGAGGAGGGAEVSLGTGGAGGTGTETGSGGMGGTDGRTDDVPAGSDSAGSGGAPASGGRGGDGSAGTGGTPAGTGGTSAGTGGSAAGGSRSIDAGLPDGGLSQGLVAYYPCENSSGASLPDVSGNKRDAVLVTGTGGTAGYSFAPGKVGNALDFEIAQQGFATLPADLLQGATEATVATWVYINNNNVVWQRIFDFGKDTTSYMFLTSNGGNSSLPRFAITVGGKASEQMIEGPAALPTKTWTHIAIVLGPSGGIMYVGGVQFTANTGVSLRPADLGSLTNGYIGRSRFAKDPYFDGDIDEFRVYNRALSPSEIQSLASGS